VTYYLYNALFELKVKQQLMAKVNIFREN